jgi:hypothetical protein
VPGVSGERDDLIDRNPAAQEKLVREIYELGQIIQSNASALASKTMYDRDRESLRRQLAVRVAHQKLLQQRLDRLQASKG